MTQESYNGFKATMFGILTMAVAVPLIYLWPVARRMEAASGQLLDCTVWVDGHQKGNPACLQSQLLAITGSTRATMGAVAKAAPDITASIRSASINSVEASRSTAATAQAAATVLNSVNLTMLDVRAMVEDLDASVKSLTIEAHGVLKTTDESTIRAIDQLTVLEKTLDSQIALQSPEVGNTLRAMSKLLQDPALIDTMQHMDATSVNIQAGTEHIAALSETFDIATRGLRQKAGRVKFILEKIAGLIKITLPLF